MGQRYDYGSWWTYVFQRLGGLELAEFDIAQIAQAKARPGEITLASFGERRDWQRFADAYGDPSSGASLPNRDAMPMAPVCRGPITYTGQEAVQRDIADLKAALAATGPDGRLPELGRARQLRPVRQRVLRQRRGTAAGVRGRHARGVRGDHRLGAWPAARRPRDRRELGPDQPGPERRGLPAVHDGAGRGAQLGDPRAADRADPVPPVLGQLARPAHDRPADGRRRRADAGGARGRVLVRGGQRQARARVEGLAGREAARTARSSCPASSATPPTSSSTPSWWPTGSPGSPRSSAGRT